MTSVALALTLLGAMASVVAAVAVAGSGAEAQVPGLATSAIAWSAGVMVAFGASLRAVHLDREEGVASLVRARGGSVGAYVAGRVGGLVVVLAASLGGASLVAGAAATSFARPVGPALVATLAAVAYACTFAVTIGPLAMAALGARTRVGGYLTLLAVLALPEVLAPWTAGLLPRGWHELTSVPAALAAVRAGVASPSTMAAPMARALAALAAVVAVSLLVVVARVRWAEPER
ncbi:MAG TPA: hypothetical protein VGG39_19865 [Polyangiaceae bacterium]